MFTQIEFDKWINAKQAFKNLVDTLQEKLDRFVCQASIEALSKPLFDDKKNPGVKLCASNDTERKLAIEYAFSFNPEITVLSQELQEAKRDYAASCERLECAQLIMKYEIAKLNSEARNV